MTKKTGKAAGLKLKSKKITRKTVRKKPNGFLTQKEAKKS